MAVTKYHDIRFIPGDLLWWSGRTWASRLIQLGTCTWQQLWRGEWISHGSIVANHQGRPKNYESTTLCPLSCEEAGKLVDGVQVHDIYREIEAYDGLVWWSRLRQPLVRYQAEALERSLMKKLGRSYDWHQAIASGSPHWMKQLYWRRPDDSQLYCDELQLFELRDLHIVTDRNPCRETPASLALLVEDRAITEPMELIKS